MKFRKHIAIILTLFVLFANSSASVVLHFCGDNIASVGFSFNQFSNEISEEIETCCAKKAKQNKKCCSDKKIKSENKLDFSVLEKFQINFEAVNFQYNYEFFQTYAKRNITKKSDNFKYCFNSNAPPKYKLFSQLVFYA